MYADQSHGWDVVNGPTGGYIVGFIFAAALCGWLAERGHDQRFATATSSMLAGNVIIYLFDVFGVVDAEAASIWPRVAARHRELFGDAPIDQVTVTGL